MPALSVSELTAKAEAAVASGTPFTLAATELGLPDADRFFAEYLGGGELLVQQPVAFDAATLTVSGAVDLAGVGGRVGVEVRFTADQAGAQVAALQLAAALDSWEIRTSYLTVSLSDFSTGYGFDSAVLLLGVGPGPQEATGSWAAAGLAFSVRSRQACLVVRELDEAGQYELFASFSSGLGLPDVAALVELPGLAQVSADRLALPPGVPTPGGLGAITLHCGIAPAAGGMRWAWVRAGLAGADWQVAPDLLVLEELSVLYGFGWDEPDLGLEPACLVSAELGAALRVGRNTLVATVSLPDLVLTAHLASPPDTADLVGDRLAGSGIAAGVGVRYLSATARLTDRYYSLSLGLDLNWRFFDQVEVSGVALELSGQGGPPDLVRVTGALGIGDQLLLLEARRGFESSWLMSASTGGLELSALADWIQKTFSVTLPDALTGLEIDSVTLVFEPATNTLTLDSTGSFPIGDARSLLAVHARLARPSGGGGYQAAFWGELGLTLPATGAGLPRDLTFKVDYSTGADGALTGVWSGEPGCTTREVAAALGLPIPAGVPDALLPTLTSVALRRASGSGRLVVASATQAGGGVVIASLPGTPGSFAVLVKASIPARLSELPLVGGQVPAGADLGVSGVQLLVSSNGLTGEQLEQVNADLAAMEASSSVSYPRLPDQTGGLPAGAVLALPYDIAGEEQEPLTLAFGSGGDGQLVGRSAAAAASGWADVGRSFGPLHVYRIGVGYDADRLLVMFDAAMGAAGLTIGVRGLGLALDLGTKEVTPRLDGLSIELERNPLHVAGAFVNRQPPPEDYQLMVEGMLVVEMPKFGALAVGAYQRRTDGMTSLFAFGRATAPFGGPPPFRVTGFALGFGFNSGVRIPEQEEIGGFPLVAGLDGCLPDDPLAVLAELTSGSSPWVAPQENQIWLAGGLDFTSFEFLQARVLLLLEAGQDLTLALLGRATASFPKQGRPYARIGVDLRVVYQSSRGRLAASAQLTDSFVIDPAAALSGGFAFYLWFGPSPYAGDFVVTVGGYHPDYPVPDHFPVVPRLGFNWSLGPVSITGGAYFALTPNAVMAGGLLDVRYKSGNVEAWLTARADILIQWAPLFFRAGISIRIGAKVKLLFTVKGELGASLDLWGPKTGGTVTAKFTFIKITVKFGAPLTGPDPLTWSQFQEQLLPQQAPLTVTPLTGLLTDADADPELQAARIESGEEPWLVSPGGFSFAVASVVPTARARFNEEDEIQGAGIDIRPMRVTGLDGLLSVTVDYYQTGQRNQWRAVPGIDDWQVAEQWDRVPFSLWGDPAVADKDALSSGDGLLSRITGLTVTVPGPRVNGQDLGPVAERDLAWEKLTPDAPLPLDPDAEPVGSPVREAEPAGAGVALVAGHLARLAPAAARTRLHGVLDGLLADDEDSRQPLPNGTLDGLAVQAATVGLDADPLLLTEDSAPPPPEPVVFVLDDTTQSALAVDAAGGSVLLRIPLGQPGGYLAAVTGDGGLLYAVGAQGREITVLDTAAARALPPRPTGLSGAPTAFAVTADGERAVVARPGSMIGAWVDLTGAGEPEVTVVDQQLQQMSAVAVDADAAGLYGVRQDTGRTAAWDAADGALTGQSGRAIGPIWVTPGRDDRVFVYGNMSGGKGGVQVVQPTAADTHYEPVNFDAQTTPLGLLTDSARNAVLLRRTSDRNGLVSVFVEQQGSPPRTVQQSQTEVGPEPKSLALDPAGRAWVLHQQAVSLVRGSQLLGVVELDAEPLAITFTPDSARAFVACADATVAVVEPTEDGLEAVEHWQLPPGTVPSAARYTEFTATESTATATASEGAGR